MSWQVGLYAAAVLIPLAAFTVEAIFIRQLKRLYAYLATGAIGLSCLLSLVGFVDYYFDRGGRASRPSTTPSGRARRAGEDTRRGPRASRGARPARLAGSFDWVVLGGKPLAGPTNDPAGDAQLSLWACPSTTWR